MLRDIARTIVGIATLAAMAVIGVGAAIFMFLKEMRDEGKAVIG